MRFPIQIVALHRLLARLARIQLLILDLCAARSYVESMPFVGLD